MAKVFVQHLFVKAVMDKTLRNGRPYCRKQDSMMYICMFPYQQCTKLNPGAEAAAVVEVVGKAVEGVAVRTLPIRVQNILM